MVRVQRGSSEARVHAALLQPRSYVPQRVAFTLPTGEPYSQSRDSLTARPFNRRERTTWLSYYSSRLRVVGRDKERAVESHHYLRVRRGLQRPRNLPIQ